MGHAERLVTSLNEIPFCSRSGRGSSLLPNLLQDFRLVLLAYFLLSLAWVVIIPPWQGPDEPGHYEYARLLSDLHRPPRPQDANPELQAEIIRDLDAHDFWRLTHQPRPAPLPSRFQEVPFLKRSGTQLGNEPTLYYLAPALFFHALPNVPTLHLYIGRIYSVLLGSLILFIGHRAARYRFSSRPDLAAGMSSLLALLPMPIFIHATFSSNAFKDLVGAMFFALAWKFFSSKAPLPLRYWIALGGIVAAAAMTGGPTWLLLLAGSGILFLSPHSPVRPWLRPLLYGGIIVGIALLLFPHNASRAATWERGPERKPAIRIVGAGRDGSAALYLVDRRVDSRGYVAQNLPGATIPTVWGMDLEARAWVRALQGPVQACLSLADGVTQSVTCVDANSRWQEIILYHPVSPGASYIRVVLGVGKPRSRDPVGVLLVDDFAVQRVRQPENLLRNGGAEKPLSRPLYVLTPLLRQMHLIPSPVYTPERWNRPLTEKLLLAAAVLFTSFWGNYGWLQYPLPVPVYILLSLVTLGVLGGVGRWVRRRDLTEETVRLMRFDGIVVGAIIIGSILPTLRADWLPQGRYLFPYLLPLLALGVQGLEAWRPRSCSPRIWIGLWLGLTAAFHLFSLLWTAIAM